MEKKLGELLNSAYNAKSEFSANKENIDKLNALKEIMATSGGSRKENTRGKEIASDVSGLPGVSYFGNYWPETRNLDNTIENIGKPDTTTMDIMRKMDIPMKHYQDVAKILGESRVMMLERAREND